MRFTNKYQAKYWYQSCEVLMSSTCLTAVIKMVLTELTLTQQHTPLLKQFSLHPVQTYGQQ